MKSGKGWDDCLLCRRFADDLRHVGLGLRTSLRRGELETIPFDRESFWYLTTSVS